MKMQATAIDWSIERGSRDAPAFVLLLHGMDAGQNAILGVADAIAETLGACHMLVPKMPLRWNDHGDMKELARAMLRRLEAVDLTRYERVYIVGHSAGGVLAQAIYLLSRDESENTRVELRAARFVLIAPLNRGWELSHHLPLSKKLAWMVGLSLLPFIAAYERIKSVFRLRLPRPLWLLQLRRFSPFLVWMRLTWMDLRAKNEIPEVVQLLGSVDELVSWNDMVDPATGQDFVYFEVPFSNHLSVIDYELPEDATEEVRERAAKRREILQLALGDYAEAASNEKWAITPWDSDPVPPDERVRRVVFVIHGIRDEGHWTQKIASRARRHYVEQGHDHKEVAVETSRYGYFSMLQFLIYGQRRQKVNWLVEKYVETRRRYPKATFSYVGHSNGTYLVAHALERFPEIKFERVAFAGSVVSSRFDWGRLHQKEQVKHVLNYAATADWVVGIFPRIADILPPLKLLLGPSLGGAGIEPFKQEAFVQTLEYRVGQHGAAIQEKNWNALARFAVAEEEDFFPVPKPVPEEDPDYDRAPWWPFGRAFGWATSIGIWGLLICTLIWWMPKLVWNVPVHFWATLVATPLLLALSFAVADQFSRRAPLHGRAEAQKKAFRYALLAGVAVVALLLWLSPLLGWFSYWTTAGGDGLAMAACILYFVVVFAALTKI